jgi:itaconate CoA-transferase
VSAVGEAQVELPLTGTRVIGLEQSVAAPLCTRILAELGATVIKIERAGVGDFARHWDAHANGESSYFTWLNRRKKGISLDLRTEEGLQTLDHLLEAADVLVTNMTPAAAERLGLVEQRLRSRYPRLVVCHISGYGSSGPLRDRKAYDMLVQAETAIMSLTGGDDGPTRVGVSLGDIGTGLYATILVLGALMDRLHSERGRFIDLAMFDAMLEFIAPNLVAFANAGVEYPKRKARHHAIAPYGVFACADAPLAIAVEQDDEWRRLCTQVFQREDLAENPRYASNEKRMLHRDEIEEQIEAIFVERPREAWVKRLEHAGIAFGLINDVPAVWRHTLAVARALRGVALLPDGSSVNVPRGPAERVFGIESEPRVPALGEHDAEIRDWLAAGRTPGDEA